MNVDIKSGRPWAARSASLSGLFLRAYALLLCLTATASAQETPGRGSEFPEWFIAVPLLLAALALGLGWYAWRQWKSARRSRSWPTTRCTILQARIASRTETGSEGDTHTVYEPRVRYAYEIGGRRYEGDRIRFGAFRESEKGARAILDRYPVGASVEVRYDPSDPSVAALETRTAGIGIQVFGVVVLSALAIFMVCRMWFW